MVSEHEATIRKLGENAAQAAREYATRIESLEAKLEKAKEALWKIQHNEDAAYSRDLAIQALKELSQ